MRYIIFTLDGSGYPIAKQLMDEGLNVEVAYVDDESKTLLPLEKPNYKPEGKSSKKMRLQLYKNIFPTTPADVMVKRMKTFKNPRDYFVFFDFNNFFYYAEKIKDLGFHGNFPTKTDRLLEVDRNAAKEFVKKHYPHLNVTKKKEFLKVGDAVEFLEKDTNKIWVLKGQSYEAKTYVPTTKNSRIANQQIIEILQYLPKLYEAAGFFLEEKIDDMIEITPEKMYYNGKPICITMNFENKYFGSENSSIQVGCAQDFVFPISMNSKIHDIAFPPLVDEMAKKHSGLFIWDASILIDRKTREMYFGEFCANRAGYNSFFTEVCQAPSVHFFFEQIVKGKNPFQKQTFGASVRLFSLLKNPDTNDPISDVSVNYDSQISNHVWNWDVYKKNKNANLSTLGYDWEIGVVTGSGPSVQTAVRNAYENIASFSYPGLYFRPESDFLSNNYPSSILNRLEYCKKQKIYQLLYE